VTGAAVAALQLENSRLREEVDSLKRRLPALGLLRRTSSNVQLAGAATDQLLVEVAQVGGPFPGWACPSIPTILLSGVAIACFCNLVTELHDGCLCTCMFAHLGMNAVAGRQRAPESSSSSSSSRRRQGPQGAAWGRVWQSKGTWRCCGGDGRRPAQTGEGLSLRSKREGRVRTCVCAQTQPAA
jgi:hypothetical protein